MLLVRSTLVILLMVALTAALALLATGDAEAVDRDVFGDMVISTDTTITGETIDVRGSVVVQASATLKLEGCDLAINGTENGQRRLEVRPGGRLEAYGTAIYGNDARIQVVLNDDSIVEGCEIYHVHGSSGTRGVVLGGGTILFKDTAVYDVNWHGMDLNTDITLDNVTVSQVTYSNLYISNYYGMSSPVTILIKGGHLAGNRQTGYYTSGILLSTYSQGERIDIVIEDMTFEDHEEGIYVTQSNKLDAKIDRCVFTDCRNGIGMGQSSTTGTVAIRYNKVTGSDWSDSVGYNLVTAGSLTLEGNEVAHVDLGYRFNGPWSGSDDTSIGHIVVANCTRGIAADRNLHLTVHNSSVTQISDSYGSFIATDGATITIFDTEHAWGSGTASDAGSWVRAYKDVEVLGAKWKGGLPIVQGFLILENITNYEVARFDLGNPRSQDIVGWEVDSSGPRTSRFLYPALYIDEQGFWGDRFDIKEYTPRVFELVDGFSPIMDIASPIDGHGYNVSTIVASGTYEELGSGMMRMEYSLDGGPLTTMTDYYDGNWTLPLIDLPEGEHTLVFHPIDRANNVGEDATATFVVDTVVPLIDLAPVPELVNVTSIEVAGTTEPHATVTVQGRNAPVAPDGTFNSTVELREGANTIAVQVVDRARNVNSTSISLHRDTIAPELLLTAPEGDVWTNLHTVYVEGLTEDGTDTRVQGQPVPVVNGSFRKRVDLEAGEFVIRVSSADRAGNIATGSITLLVDWTPPVLTLVEPEEVEVYMKETTFYISCDVDDPSIDHVLLNDQIVELVSGRFVKQYTVLEGRNEFAISVTDAAGNVDSVLVVVIRDLTAPSPEVTLNAEGGELVYKGGDLYSTSLAIEAVVSLDEESVVRLDDGTELPLSTEVRIRYTLKEGANELAFTVRDRAGNQAPPYSQRVIVDTTPPSITIYEPSPGSRTLEETAIIHGVTEAGSQLTIGGQGVQLLSGGEFRHVVALEAGRNDFSLEVVDAMGNSNSTSVSILRDTKVKEEEVSTTGPTIGGFLVGLIVGVALALAFVMVRGRGTKAEVMEEAPSRRAEQAPARDEEPPEGKGEQGGWEEF